MRFQRTLVAFVAISTAFYVPASARGNKQINDWQKAIVDIGKSITARDQSGSSWIVEYNSSFPSTDIGLVLAPSSYDRKTSSLNIVAICLPVAGSTVSTEGRDFAEFAANRSILFNANAAPPPGFVSGSLAAANASLRLDSSKRVDFSLNDTQVKQVLESDAIDAINAPACLRRIRHRSEVFYVRGQYLMRLTMAQHRASSGSVGAALGQTTNSPSFGFGVSWNRALDWQIAQTKPRPWFRIVSRFRKNSAGTAYEIID